ncbi:MAG: CotH kinase family protein [Verrucomicrobia bacterium]|nr:CotH kinase family protein [Verrucomicrobiota bacterium]MBI3867547.1 CotH kinase family protein [Verrucomicrobiota bacterium]
MKNTIAIAALCLSPLFASHALAGVVINEIFYHAPDDLDDLQWIELHNADSQPVDVSGWRLTKGVHFQFPGKTVMPPGGFLVLCKDAQVFSEFYSVKPDGQFKKSFGRGGGTLELVDSAGKSVDRVKFDDRDPWPSSADGVSSSLERITPAAPGDQAANWSASPLPEDLERPTGTPGQTNASYSASFPPLISGVKVSPSTPVPGQPARVQALVESAAGVATIELRYRVAKPGALGEEKAVTMTAADGRNFSAEIPGLEASSLVRARVRAVDQRRAERFYPSPHSLQPAISLFVAPPAEAATVPLAYIVNCDPREHAAMERVRARSLKPDQGPFGNQDSSELQTLLGAGLNLPAAWFEWTVNHPADVAAYRKLRTVFLSMNAERNRLIEETLTADDIAGATKALPARIQAFQASFVEKVKSAIPSSDSAAFEAWRQRQMSSKGDEMGGFLTQMLAVEGGWMAMHSRVEFTPEQIEKLKPALKKAVQGRSDTAAKMMKGGMDFGKLMEALGVVGKELDAEYHRLLTVSQRRALDEWRRSQPSPIRPRLGDVHPRPPRGNTAFIVSSKTGGVEVFDFLHVTERSAGYKVRFHKDHTWNGMTAAAIIFEYKDRFLMAEPLAFELYHRLGHAACDTDFIRLSMNGHLLGYHLVVEQVNGAFLRRNKLDAGGDLFKILWYGNGIEGQHEKQNHPDRSHADLLRLIAALESTTGAEQWAVIQKNFNVDQAATYFAVNMVLSHWDGFFNNYFTFQNRKKEGKWEMYPWDQDKTWGFHDASGDKVFFDMPLTFGMAGDRPPGGGEPVLNPGSWWRPGGFFSKPLLANPEFRQVYLRRIRQILEETYNEKVFFPIIDAMADRLRPEVAIRAGVIAEDPAKANSRLDQNVASFKEHLVKRRQFLLQQDELAKLPR